MDSSDVIELVSEMKRLGVAYFKHGGLEVAFNDREPVGSMQPLFSDQQAMLNELAHAAVDGDGKPAVVGYSDEDLFGSA